MTKPGKSSGQLRHINQRSWASSNCDGNGKVLVWVCKWGWKQPCQGGLTKQNSPMAVPSLLAAPCQFLHEGKPQPSPTGTGNRYMAVWHTSKEHFPLAGTSPSTTLVKTLQSNWEHTVTQAPQGQLLVGPPTGTGHWIPAVWGVEPTLPAGRGVGCSEGERQEGSSSSPLHGKQQWWLPGSAFP